MRHIWRATALVALVFMAPSPPAVALEATHWRHVHAAPFVVTVYDRTLDASWAAPLRNAAAEWNAGIDNIELVFAPGAADCGSGAGPATTVICVRNNADEKHRAETRWYVTDGHLDYATVWIDTMAQPAAGRRSTACHELGHVLGLAHRTGGPTCMTPTADGSHPDAQDFRAVTDAHAHRHPTAAQ